MQNSKILKWAVIVGIIIVLNLFFNFALRLVYVEPKYDDFCKQEQINIAPDTAEKCVAQGGQWNENNVIAEKPMIVGETVARGYCNTSFTCQKEYETARNLYSRNVFVVLVVLGLFSIVAGFFTTSAMVVSTGLSLGGVLSLIVASIRYWSAMEDYLRVIILGLALATLIYLGYKKLKD